MCKNLRVTVLFYFLNTLISATVAILTLYVYSFGERVIAEIMGEMVGLVHAWITKRGCLTHRLQANRVLGMYSEKGKKNYYYHLLVTARKKVLTDVRAKRSCVIACR